MTSCFEGIYSSGKIVMVLISDVTNDLGVDCCRTRRTVENVC